MRTQPADCDHFMPLNPSLKVNESSIDLAVQSEIEHVGLLGYKRNVIFSSLRSRYHKI